MNLRKRFAIPIVILSLLLIHGCKKEEKAAVPVILTAKVTEISYTSAISGGNVLNDGGAPVISRGVCWNTAVNPAIINSKTPETGTTGSFSTNMTGLTPNTLYYVRSYATNSAGTAYGDQASFTTLQSTPPVLGATTSVTGISYTTATSGGNVTSEGGNPVTSRGVCWNTAGNPTITDSKSTETGGAGSFSTNLTGLTANTLYYVRAYATNGSGTSYGDQVTFTTSLLTVTDVDGNLYNVVIIGNQFWMKENLKTTRYQNGDLIGTTIPATLDLNYESMKKFQWAYDGNEANVTPYGRLYTWYAVTDDRKVCPSGWHVPSDSEWSILESFLGGPNIAGGKLKETGTINWINPNAGANNETGFTALPSGGRALMGIFEGIGIRSVLWTSTEKNIPGTNSTVFALSRTMVSNNSIIYSNVIYNKLDALAVRCLKD